MPHWRADPARFAALCQGVVECVFGQRLGPGPTQRGLAPQIRWRPWCLRAASCSKPITYLHFVLHFNTITKQVRNRFAAQSPPGGYRDMNLKIRVGFKSDPNTGHPLFCPVYVESFAAAATISCFCVLTIRFRKEWDQKDVKTMVSHSALIMIGLLTSGLQVVEIQVQLKVRPCTPVLCSRSVLLDV